MPALKTEVLLREFYFNGVRIPDPATEPARADAPTQGLLFAARRLKLMSNPLMAISPDACRSIT